MQNFYDYNISVGGSVSIMARVDRDRRYISWGGMALGAVLLLVLFGVSMHWVRGEITKLEAQNNTLQMQVSLMEMDYADLLLDLQRVGSDGYVENIARNKLDYIRQGEIVFAFENPDALKGYTEEECQIIMDEMRD